MSSPHLISSSPTFERVWPWQSTCSCAPPFAFAIKQPAAAELRSMTMSSSIPHALYIPFALIFVLLARAICGCMTPQAHWSATLSNEVPPTWLVADALLPGPLPHPEYAHGMAGMCAHRCRHLLATHAAHGIHSPLPCASGGDGSCLLCYRAMLIW